MLFRNCIVFPLLIGSLNYGQGIVNGFGLGHFNSSQGSMNAGQCLNRILPAFQNGVALSNPATWPNLKFTQLSLSYSAIKNSVPVLNEYSGLSSGHWIIPIKGRAAIGFSISPYTNQNIAITDTASTKMIAFGDTLSLQRGYRRSGGITVFKVGSGLSLNKKINLGAKLHFLFGSSRQSESLLMNGSKSWMSGAIIQTSRMRYSGSFLQGYLSVSPIKSTSIMAAVKFPLNPLDGLYQQYFLFYDSNDNGYHDSYHYDFPYPVDVSPLDEVRLNKIHSPVEYTVGVDQRISPRTNVMVELLSYKENGHIPEELQLGINDFVYSSNSASIGLIKFPDDLSVSWTDKFTLRSGINYRSQQLKFSDISITEMGYSLGIGFKFGAVGNQIDINYYAGFREYSQSYDSEIIHQFQAGISLADIWFVKRRQKRNG